MVRQNLPAQGNSKFWLNMGAKCLFELVSKEGRSQDALEEIALIIKRKVPKLLDGLTESNKEQIARACSMKLHVFDEVVFGQEDLPDAYYTVDSVWFDALQLLDKCHLSCPLLIL